MILRQAYVDGFEIVTKEGRHPVIHMPRSRNDKLPWVREVEGIPFRYHAGELTDVHTRATIEHAARVDTGRTATEEADERRKVYMTNDDVDRHLASARGTGHLDPYWYRMS